jgi:hypothetical protein
VTDEGPLTFQLCRSVAQYISVFGPRTTTSAILYDDVEAFFALGGAQCYVIRVSDETAVAAKKVLLDSGNKPTLVFTAKTPGVEGNTIKIEVVTVSSEYEIKLLNAEGEVLEETGKLANQAAAIAYVSSLGAFTASTESEHTTNNPKTLAATALTGGANASDLTDASYVTSLAGFPKSLGPGHVSIPGRTSTTIHNGIATHCKENNRIGWGDLADSASPATLISAKGAVATGLASYINFTSGSAIIEGLTPGTTRTVQGSGLACALCARVSATGNDNQAPAGRDWPVSSFVQGFTNTFSMANMKILNEAGINAWAERGGIPCLYGFSTALSPTVDRIYWSAAAARERMALVAAVEEIAEGYEFKTIDGRGVLIAKFQGELQALISRHWQNRALFGDTAAEAGAVNVGEPTNTPAKEQVGELNAELRVRISPFVQGLGVVVVSLPITESVGV